MDLVSTELVPPVRLGKMLREQREANGWSLAGVALEHGVDIADLVTIENGLQVVDFETLEFVSRVYGVDKTTLVPARTELIIDLDEGTIHTAERSLQVGAGRPAEELLTRYLALVHTLRGIPVGAAMTLRDVDVDVLASALQLSEDSVARQLHSLMRNADGQVERTARTLRKSVVVPLAGVLVGLTTLGGLILVRSSNDLDAAIPRGGPALEIAIDAPETLERSSVPFGGVEIGTAVTLERG